MTGWRKIVYILFYSVGYGFGSADKPFSDCQARMKSVMVDHMP